MAAVRQCCDGRCFSTANINFSSSYSSCSSYTSCTSSTSNTNSNSSSNSSSNNNRVGSLQWQLLQHWQPQSRGVTTVESSRGRVPPAARVALQIGTMPTPCACHWRVPNPASAPFHSCHWYALRVVMRVFESNEERNKKEETQEDKLKR